MNKFGSFITQKRWWILIIWVVAAIAIVWFSPSLGSVESNDQTKFLPKNDESIQANDIAKQITPHSQDANDLIVFKSKANQELNASDLQTIRTVTQTLADQHLPRILSVVTDPRQLSKDGKVQLGTVIYSGNPGDTDTINAVKTLRSALHAQLTHTDLLANVTGQEATAYDTQGASTRALQIVSIGTLILVLVLPALIFRSPFAGLLPIAAVGLVDLIASALIADAATLFSFKVNQQLSVIFTVVLFGIGTDYILFLLFRYRERLRTGDHTRAAVTFALSRAGEAILSAALVVLTSFTALFFAKFGIFSSLAPGLVICVGVMMLAALTLVPALVAIVGTKVFWPSKAWRSESLNPTISKKIGGIIAKHPAMMAGIVILGLLVLSSFALGYKADFSSFSQPPKATESAAGYNDLVAALPAGVVNPIEVYVSSGTPLTPQELLPLEQKLSHTTGIATLMPSVISPNGKMAAIPAILKDNPYSNTAIADVSGPIRENAHSVSIPNATIYVGGATSIFADVEATTTRDLRVIFPIAAAFIFVILVILLRSLMAPVFLLLGVGLGYIATLGTTTLIFQRIGHADGLVFFIPMFMYLFVVAVGTDYNILTVTRLREEVREGRKPHQASELTVQHSSATVASAGLILAATFGSLLLAGINFLSQMGTAVALGVILAAFSIAPFLIPSIAAVLGYKIWWPGHRPAAEK